MKFRFAGDTSRGFGLVLERSPFAVLWASKHQIQAEELQDCDRGHGLMGVSGRVEKERLVELDGSLACLIAVAAGMEH